ncbi:hypothetical protein CL622_06965 [archaeon]|nr:hypothetical protein [archaeon]
MATRIRKQILGLVLFIGLLISGCSVTQDQDLPLSTLCSNVGGEWNECSSPCLGTEGEICATVCIEACECLKDNDFACPAGFSCQHVSDQDRGRCVSDV